jgi:hypothetical protein
LNPGVCLIHIKINFVFPDYDFDCNNNFEGGGWLRVRYNSYGFEPRWYLATDGLRGTDVYGYPGLGEYSIYYRNLMNPGSELLFVLGSFIWLACTSLQPNGVSLQEISNIG